jgi:TolA-binding protein
VASDASDTALREWAREALLALAKARLGEGALEVALDAFRRARALSPPPGRSQEARFWEAETLVRLKRPAEARTAYESVLREDPDSPLAPDTVYGLAWLELEQKRFEPAVRNFRLLLERWPDHPQAAESTFALARTLVDLKRYDEAIPVLVSFTSKYPDHAEAANARYLLGWTRLTTGKTAEGITDLRQFVETHPSHELAGMARRKITESVQRLGDRVELQKEYQLLMADRTTSAEALYDAALIGAQLGQAADHEAALRRLRAEFPSSPLAPRAALELATAAFRRAQYQETVTQATAAAKDTALQAEAMLLVGEAELKLRRWSAALKAFDAVATKPGVDRGMRARAIAGSALALEEQQQWQAALKLYETVAAENADPGLKQWARDRLTAVTTRQRQAAQRSALDQAVELFKRRRYGEAAALARSVTQSEEAGIRVEALLLIGNAELKQRHYQAAIEAFEAVSMVPEIDLALKLQAVAGTGQALEEQQLWAEALLRYEQIVSDSPDPSLKQWAEDRAATVKERQTPPPRKPRPSKPARNR